MRAVEPTRRALTYEESSSVSDRTTFMASGFETSTSVSTDCDGTYG
jgi:hypothetical protein